MDLFCEDGTRRALDDRFLLMDDRVMDNLIELEEKYTPSSNYFKFVQSEIQPYMRKMVASWMLEVTEEEKCEEDVFSLAMNYMDRFLAVNNIKKQHLQLLGAVCLFIASKLRETIPLCAEKLVIYTDHSINLEDLLEWEVIVVSKLKWDLSATTPLDFLNHVSSRMSILDRETSLAIKRHAQTFIALCATDDSFISTQPSMVACGCLAAATRGLLGNVTYWNVLNTIQNITNTDTDILQEVQEQIERALNTTVPNKNVTPQKCPVETPSTPTDMRDIVF